MEVAYHNEIKQVEVVGLILLLITWIQQQLLIAAVSITTELTKLLLLALYCFGLYPSATGSSASGI